MRLQNKDLMLFFDCTEPTAIARKREIARYYNKKNQKNIHLSQLARYEGITEVEVLESIAKKLKKAK